VQHTACGSFLVQHCIEGAQLPFTWFPGSHQIRSIACNFEMSSEQYLVIGAQE
jgi:hypothetical protein